MSAGTGICTETILANICALRGCGYTRCNRHHCQLPTAEIDLFKLLRAGSGKPSSGIPGQDAALTLHNSSAPLHGGAAGPRRYARPAHLLHLARRLAASLWKVAASLPTAVRFTDDAHGLTANAV